MRISAIVSTRPFGVKSKRYPSNDEATEGMPKKGMGRRGMPLPEIYVNVQTLQRINQRLRKRTTHIDQMLSCWKKQQLN